MKCENELKIGAYHLAVYASTPEHVRELKECGIDVVMNMRYDRDVLDLFNKYGISAVVGGILPGWFGGDGSNAGQLEVKNPLYLYQQASDLFADHPAIWGIDMGDEPSAIDFPYYGKVIEMASNCFAGKMPYLNLYPSYALKGDNTSDEITAQLGTKNYAEYIERYVQNVDTPYICFDYYIYSANLSGMLESMEVVSKACREKNREMWTVLQVNSHREDRTISEKQLHFQANCALAFGSRMIIWACYCAGWWYHNVLNERGEKTQQYEKLKKVNAWLHKLGKNYMKYRHADTFFVGAFAKEELYNTGKSAVDFLSIDSVKALHAPNAKLLVGLMYEREGNGEALFIARADDIWGYAGDRCCVHFHSDRKIKLMDPDEKIVLKDNKKGDYMFELDVCEGVLLIAETDDKMNGA